MTRCLYGCPARNCLWFRDWPGRQREERPRGSEVVRELPQWMFLRPAPGVLTRLGVRGRYAMAAERGDPVAMSRLALMLSEGRGVEKNSASAVRWWRLAATLVRSPGDT